MLCLLLALLAAPPEDMAARVSRPVALRVPGMDKVRVQRDLVYDPGSGLRLDAYTPPRSRRHPPPVPLGAVKWMCESCGFIYDPADGDPDGGIPPGTPFEDIPETWFCPVCGARKRDFSPYEE